MKIALMNDSFPPIIDGVVNTVVNYADILTKQGEEPAVITPEHPEADDSAFPYPVFRYPGIDTRKATGYIAGIPFSPQTQKKIKDFKPEIIHSHCPIMSTFLARSVARALDVPLVMTYHTKYDIDIERVIKLKLVQESALHAMVSNINACDEVWTVSHGAGENLRSIGYEGDYIVMENGVDMPKGRLREEQIRALTANINVPPLVPVFLFVGRLNWYKGIRIILDGLAGLKSAGYDFRMIFIGKGQEEEEIRRYAEEIRIMDKVTFLGAVYDREVIRAWYGRADLFLFPSTFDTNGLVVREAAASSLPAVLVRGSCAAEGVANETSGFLIEENAASLAAVLAKILDRPTLLTYVKRRVADDLYISWEQAVQKAYERYQIVIDNYKSGKYPAHLSLSNIGTEFINQISQYLRLDDPDYS